MRRTGWPLLLTFLTACTDWHPVTLPAPSDTVWSSEGRLRVTTVSGRELHGTLVLLRNDSLVVRPDSVSAELGVPRVAVSAIDRRGFSALKTATLGVMIFGVAVMMGLLGESLEDSINPGMVISAPAR
jgi:hypothetical protein